MTTYVVSRCCQSNRQEH